MIWSFLLSTSLASSLTSQPIQILFHCKTEQQKQVSVFKQGSNLIYQYGDSLDVPELHLVQAEQTVEQRPWAGVGHSMWNYITFKNKGYSYTVGSRYNRMEGKIEFAGVTVTKEGKTVANIGCRTDALFVDALGDYVEPVY